MGASESKIAERAAAKPEVPVNNSHVAQLIDPRSPSLAIDRTPIQVGGIKVVEVTNEGPLEGGDPRSPTVGIARTPVREVMRAKVGTLARRLGMFFHMEAEGKVPRNGGGTTAANEPHDVLKGEELDSTEPLLTPQRPRVFGSTSERAHLVATPARSGAASCSPFVLLEEEPQVEVEIEADDASVEEAEEARESPLHKRLSLSLVTCLEGAPSARVLAEVHRDGGGGGAAEVESPNAADHLYALPAVTLGAAKESSDPPAQPRGEVGKSQAATGARRLTLDVISPSQAVFKPQWLGKGFGATGLRARAVQGAKGGSSPLAVSVAVKNVNNENKGSSGKPKQKEGRSPLQILNSHREQAQTKLKGSTPEKPRLGQMDRRLLAVSLNKENC
ncbi:cell division cycle-associated protein 3 [Festucalex cinctus]